MATKKKAAKKKTSSKRSRKKSTTKPKALGAKPSNELRVAISFRRATDNLGLTKYGARMTSDVVHGFMPDPVTTGRVLEALTRQGFVVMSQGKVSVSVRCDRKNYERVFGTRLTAFEMRADEATRPSAGAVFYPAADAPWNPLPEVASLFDEAYIQWPHIYMNKRFDPPPSPLPPQVGYHHLRVPGDVIQLLNAAKAHRQGITGRGVRVAMIDSGFAHGHPYFQEMGYNSSVVLAPGASHVDQDGNSHGTGESANLLAIAPDATFIGVKLDNESPNQPGASVLEGFQEAMQHSPDVISVSLGFDLCPTDNLGRRISNDHLTTLPNSLLALEAEIEAAVASGVVVVFSAGNGHVAFPGMMPSVISAGGVFVRDDGEMHASSYASAFVSKIYPGRRVPDFSGLVGTAENRAEYIMLPVQRGSEIDKDKSTTDGTAQDDGWGVFSGTSASAPQLAGVCALLLQKDPNLTPSDVKQIIRRTCRDVVLGAASPASNENNGGMPAGPGTDGATGTGLVDAFAALQQV